MTDFGGSISWNTQPNCRVLWWVSIHNRSPCSLVMLILLQHSHCTLVTILFRPVAGLFVNLAMRIRALFTKSASIFWLVEQALWRMPLFTEWSGASSFDPLRWSLHGNRAIFPLGLLPLGILVLDAFFTLCCVEDLGEEFGCVDFARLFISCRKLQLSPYEHCQLAFHCQQSPRLLCSRCFILGFLTTAPVSKFTFLASKIIHSQILLDTSFYHCLQSVIIRSSFLLMNLHVVQFQYGLEFLRRSYS